MERMKNAEERRTVRTQDAVFAVVFLLCLGLLLWKAKRGIGSEDEHFYITLGQRTAQGDALFADQWDIAQMIGVFLAPLYSLFMGLRGSAEGIVYGFRLFYIVFTCFVGTVLYGRLRVYGMAAAFAAGIYMLFAPFNIMALSYNTMGMGFLIFALCAYPEKTHTPWRLILCGILMGCAVLNNPYLIFLYPLLSVFALKKSPVFPRKDWVFLSAGALCTAAVFLLFVLHGAPLKDVLASLPHVVDSSHGGSLLYHAALDGYHLFTAFGPFLLLFFAELGGALYVRKHMQYRDTLMTVSIVINILSMLYVSFVRPYFPLMGGFALNLLPCALIGLLVLILYPCEKYLQSCFTASLFLSFMLAFSSNVGPNSFCCALIFACTVTVVLLHRHFPKGLVQMAVLAALLVFFRVHEDFGGAVADYTVPVERGPLAGMLAEKSQAADYEERLADLEKAAVQECGGINIVSTHVWEYLAVPERICTGSTYLYAVSREEYIAAQEEYMASHADRLPVLILADRDNPYFDLDDPWLQNFEKIADLNQGALYMREASGNAAE